MLLKTLLKMVLFSDDFLKIITINALSKDHKVFHRKDVNIRNFYLAILCKTYYKLI